MLEGILKNKLLNLCEEKANTVRTEIASESKNRFESIDQLKSLPQHFQSSSYDYQELDETDNEIMRRIEQATSKFDESLEDQRSSLQESEKAMNEIINDMVGNIKKEIENEFSPREILISEIGAAVGSHAGPGTLAVVYKNSKEISDIEIY